MKDKFRRSFLLEQKSLINQTVITKTGESLTIIGVEESQNLKDVVIKLSNGKMYNLYLCFKSGFVRFKNDEIIKELKTFINKEEEELERLKKIEEERIKKELEKQRLEKERMETAIKEFRGEYDFLSNFYEVDITYDGFTYKNSESAFQAQKDLSRRSEFVGLTPTQSKRLGRKVNLRSDWEQVKIKIMEEILRCKFDQHPDLKEKLINTGDRLLIEGNTWNDTFWGVCRGNGKNNLGLLLMKLRKEYQQ